MNTNAFVLAVGMILCVTVSKGYAAPECVATDGNCQPQACNTQAHNAESHACSGDGCTNGCCASKPLQGRVSTDVAARLSAGTEAIKRGHLETAANCYQYVLRQDPHNAEALYGTGYLAEKNGQLPQAVFFYRMAAINDPGNGQYRVALTAAQTQMGIPVMPVSMPARPVSTLTAPTLAPPCPNLCVATQKPKSKASKFFKAAAKVGAAAAMAAASSGGLHCPVCRVFP